MNRPKTNTYPKHYDIGDDLPVFAKTISPKSWHPVIATQVDILILTTCDIFNQAISETDIACYAQALTGHV